ncbi:transcriptional regulator NrdR [Nanoarchaeota archaeon]
MRCPFCDSEDTRVSDKRETDEGKATRRRRECLKCKKRFTTYERIENIDLIVVKKDETREDFDINKVKIGLIKACEKRTVSRNIIDKVAYEIESELLKKKRREVKTSDIGLLVMKKLKKLDKVAYVRFASVYKEFKDVAEFKKELESLRK